jgi:hypothetical protein
MIVGRKRKEMDCRAAIAARNDAVGSQNRSRHPERSRSNPHKKRRAAHHCDTRHLLLTINQLLPEVAHLARPPASIYDFNISSLIYYRRRRISRNLRTLLLKRTKKLYGVSLNLFILKFNTVVFKILDKGNGFFFSLQYRVYGIFHSTSCSVIAEYS